jgi:hypothetical protein
MGDNEQTPALPAEVRRSARQVGLDTWERLSPMLSAKKDDAAQYAMRMALVNMLDSIEEWLAGRTVLELPQPVNGDQWCVGLFVLTSMPGEVELSWGDQDEGSASWPVGEARDLFTAGLAACDVAERLASESSGDGENDAE